MPKLVAQIELDAVVHTVARFPEGASLEEIHHALELKLPRRTLQRRLAQLVGQKRLTAAGHGRASRYRVPSVEISAVSGRSAEQSADLTIYIPVSLEGEGVRQAVRAPMQNRRPVGYNRAFIDTYKPNQTFYLSREIRQRLLEMGRSPDGHRPAGTYARQIYNRLLIDLSWNSSRLEGNTYSLLDTERLLERGEAAEGKDARETQMILNHKAAIDLLVDQTTEIGFNRYTILNLHGLLSENLLANPAAGGRLRTIPVMIAGTVYHPLEVPQLIQSRGKPRRLRRGRSARTAWPSRIWLSVRGFLLQCPT